MLYLIYEHKLISFISHYWPDTRVNDIPIQFFMNLVRIANEIVLFILKIESKNPNHQIYSVSSKIVSFQVATKKK